MPRKMKPSGIDWIGDIPASWELVRTKNKFSNHKDVAGDKADDYERLALTLGGVIKRPKDDSTGLQPEAFNGYQILRQNELVFKLIDLANVATSRVGYSPYTGLVSPAYIILTPRHEFESKYGVYFFLSMWQREIFNHMGDDGVRSSLNASDLLNIPYLSIPYDEQRRIVDFLDTECSRIDEVIAQTRASIEEYKRLKQSVITEAVTKGIHSDRPMKDSGIEWIGEIPTDWEIAPIKRVLTEQTTKTPTGEGEQLSVNQKKGVVKTSESGAANPSLSTIDWKLVAINDIVFNKYKAHSGVFFVSQYNGIVTFNYSVFRCLNNNCPKYFEYQFKTDGCIAEFRKQMRGVGDSISPLYTKDLFRIIIAVPPISEQYEISGFISKKMQEIDSLISKKELLISELENLKKSLIYEYVTGKKEA